jgi:hypothetical protein
MGEAQNRKVIERLTQWINDACRLTQSGGVRIDGEVVDDPEAEVDIGHQLRGKVLQIGRRRFVRLG